MSRLSIWSACLFGLGSAIIGLAPWGLSKAIGQPPAAKQADPKQADPKKTEPKKTEPKKTEPKPPETKSPTPKAPPEYTPTEVPVLILDGAPSPLELVRGLREQGMSDFALDYLHEVDTKTLPEDVKSALPLERARCQLDAADDEADEGTRTSLIAEAKDGFSNFLKANPTHPRAAEAYLALARLTSLEAKAQLTKARRVDLPPGEGGARDAAIQTQRAEAAAARPLFKAAASQFKAAADLIKAQLEKKPEQALRRALTQAQYDAELASGTNQFALGDTYLHASAQEKKERSDTIDEARKTFSTLANDHNTPARVGWVAHAWVAECEYEKDNVKVAQDGFNQILAATGADAEDGKRTVQFFQIRRKFVQGLGSLPDMASTEREARLWLIRYGNVRRAQAEAVAIRWYLAYSIQAQADSMLPPPPKQTDLKNPPSPKQTDLKTPPPPPPTVPPAARLRYADAERIYRTISQTDNEYSARAIRQRMYVVRRMLGEADRPPGDYSSFEECQMASLIQMSKLNDLEKTEGKESEVKARLRTIVSLLERAKMLSTDKDNPSDVAEVLIRLIYFYERTEQPYEAAVLGEYVARTIKVAGGKAALGGALGLDGYTVAATQIRITEEDKLEAARRSDRDRAFRLARFLDEKFPNDTATDRARHRLAALFYEDGKPVEAYDILLKIRPGYEQIGTIRLFQGAVAAQLLSARDSPLSPDRRKDVFRRTAGDLDKVARPVAEAPVEAARAYVSCRCRLSLLYLQQPKIDPDGEKADPGYAKARKIAEEAIAAVPGFRTLAADDKALNPDGWEMKLLAEDARTRAAFLESQTEFVTQHYEPAFAAVGPILAEMKQGKPYADEVKQALGLATPSKKEGANEEASSGPDSALKTRVLKTAEGVDKLRRDVIVLALRVRVKQGKADQGAELLALLKQYGGSIEANITTLQQLTGEIAGQIQSLRKVGKNDEAKAMSEGFGKLLDVLSQEPTLPPAVQIFLGQSLVLVGEFGKAEEALKKVPPPADKGLLAKPLSELKEDQRKQVLEYRRANLELLRCYRQAKKYPQGEALILAVMGTKEKPEWGNSSMEFRKEYAFLYEALGDDESDTKKSNALWGKAVQEWTFQSNLARKRLETQPKGEDGKPDNAAILRNKTAFFEAFFEYHRCIVKANMHLVKAGPKLQKTFDDIGKKFADMERQNGPDMVPEVRAKYAEFLLEVPELKKAYEAAGGKLFLEKPVVNG